MTEMILQMLMVTALLSLPLSPSRISFPSRTLTDCQNIFEKPLNQVAAPPFCSALMNQSDLRSIANTCTLIHISSQEEILALKEETIGSSLSLPLSTCLSRLLVRLLLHRP
jgi:hypothetical protein